MPIKKIHSWGVFVSDLIFFYCLADLLTVVAIINSMLFFWGGAFRSRNEGVKTKAYLQLITSAYLHFVLPWRLELQS